MCLEDLLFLNHVLFRGTIHGTKAVCYNKESFDSQGDEIAEILNPKCFYDGSIDIAYVFYPPSGDMFMNSSIHLKRRGLQNGELLLPTYSGRRTDDVGAYLSTTPGFPEFVGYATRNGRCGEPNSSVCSSGVRKVKAYITKWTGDSFHGKVIYDTPVVVRAKRHLESVSSLYQGCITEDRRKPIYHQLQAEKISEAFELVQHDIDHRRGLLNLSSTRFGLRTEFTCYLDSEFTCFLAPSGLLGFQDWRSSLTAPDVLEMWKTNPDSFPWWSVIPLSEMSFGGRAIGTDDLPIAIVPRGLMGMWSIGLENDLLQLCKDVYFRGISSLTRTDLGGFSPTTDFIPPLLAHMSLRQGCSFVSLLSSALLTLCNQEVDSALCVLNSAYPVSPLPPLLACGATASLWYTGFPAIILSRVCAFPLFSSEFEIATKHVSLLDARRNNVKDDDLLPKSLRFTTVQGNLDLQDLMFFGSGDGRSASVPETAFYAISKHIDRIFRLVRSSENFDQEPAFKQAIYGIAVIIIRLLTSDVNRTAEAVYQRKGQLRGRRKYAYLRRFSSSTDGDDIHLLSEKALRGEMWPNTYRLDRSLTDGSKLDTCASIEEICSPFQGAAIVAQLKDTGPHSRRTIPVDADGYLKDEDFIQALWSLSKTLSERNVIAHGKLDYERSWLSVKELTSIYQICSHQSYIDVGLINVCVPHLWKALSQCMKCVGFGTVCPAIFSKRTGMYKTAHTLWGPDLLFTKMKFVEPQSLTRIFQENQVDAEVTHSDEVTPEPESLPVRYSTLRDCFMELECLNHRLLRTSPLSRSWHDLAKAYTEVSNKFWNTPETEDVLFLYVNHMYDESKDEASLIELDLEWARILVSRLVALRKALGDEGIAARYNQTTREFEKYEDNPRLFRRKEIFSLPWKGAYPDARHVFGKKSRVKHLGTIFKSTPSMLFKCMNKKARVLSSKADEDEVFEYSTNQPDETISTSDIPFIYVEDVYRLFRERHEAASISKSHWRLAPTRIVAGLILSYLEELG